MLDTNYSFEIHCGISFTRTSDSRNAKHSSLGTLSMESPCNYPIDFTTKYNNGKVHMERVRSNISPRFYFAIDERLYALEVSSIRSIVFTGSGQSMATCNIFFSALSMTALSEY